jgi:hypothetical protein
LLDRAWGKAPLQIETTAVTGNVRDWREIFYETKDEIAAEMEKARAINNAKRCGI